MRYLRHTVNRLKEWRQLRGLTQQELSKASGVSLRTISRYEATEPKHYSYAVLRDLAKALRIRVGDLLEG